MKKLTLILIACVFSIFFLNVASAIVVSGGFDGQESNIAIKNGDSAEFYVETFSMSLPMEISIEVFDSNDKLIHTFEGNTEVGLSTFEKTYTLTKNIYENEGDFRIVIIGSDESQSTRTQTLFLKVTETNEEPTPTENTAPRINSIPFDGTFALVNSLNTGVSSQVLLLNNVLAQIQGQLIVKNRFRDLVLIEGTNRIVNVLEGLYSTGEYYLDESHGI